MEITVKPNTNNMSIVFFDSDGFKTTVEGFFTLEQIRKYVDELVELRGLTEYTLNHEAI